MQARPMLPRRALRRSPKCDVFAAASPQDPRAVKLINQHWDTFVTEQDDLGLFAASPAAPLTGDASFAPFGGGGGSKASTPSTRASTRASSEASTSSSAAAAKRVVDAAAADPAFWAALVQHEEAVAFLAKTVKAKAQRDASFAQLVVTCRPLGLAAPSPRAPPCFGMQPLCTPSTPSQRLGLIAEEAATPARSGQRSSRKRAGGVLGAATSTRQRASALGAGTPAARAAASLGIDITLSLGKEHAASGFGCVPASAPPRAGVPFSALGTDKHAIAAIESRRSLLGAFDDECEPDFLGTPAKCPKREPGSSRSGALGARTPGLPLLGEIPPLPTFSGGDGAADAPPIPEAGEAFEGLFPSLPATAVASLVGFLPLAEKLQLACACRGAASAMEDPAAWEPLVMDRRQCGGLLRHLRRQDPMGVWSPEEYPLPVGLSQASELRIELMEPDCVTPHGDTAFGEPFLQASPSSGCGLGAFGGGMTPRRAGGFMALGGTPAGSPREPPTPSSGFGSVLDPLDELCRRLRRGWFSAARRIEISNIEDHRMDYHFLILRGSVFSGFPHVRVEMGENGRYALVAQRGDGAPPLPCADVAAARAESAARQPPEAPLLLPPAQDLNSAEAVFLKEHASVFKSGDNFHFTHAPWRSYPGESVRSKYQTVLETLARAGA